MKKNKVLRNKLKAVKDVYPENCKSLMKEIDLYQLNILTNTKQNNSKNSYLVMS